MKLADRLRDRALDALMLALAVLAQVEIGFGIEPGGRPVLAAPLAALLATLPLLGRHRFPFAAPVTVFAFAAVLAMAVPDAVAMGSAVTLLGLLVLARRLVAAGHRVRVLSEPTVEDDARAVGCAFTPWPTAPSIAAVGRDTAVIKDWTVRGRIVSAPRVGREVMFGPAGRFAGDVLDTLERYPADAVLADVTQLGALIGAERSGLPTVGLLSSIYIRPTPGHPVMGSGAVPATGPVGRLRDAVAPRALLRLAALGLPQLNAVRAELGMAPMAQVLDLWDRCARVLVMTSPTFDPPPARLPANVRYVGPVTDDPPWAEPWTPPWPIADRPFVLVAMSSTYQGHAALLQRIVAALDAEPVHALVTLGPGLRAGEVTGTSTVAGGGLGPARRPAAPGRGGRNPRRARQRAEVARRGRPPRVRPARA